MSVAHETPQEPLTTSNGLFQRLNSLVLSLTLEQLFISEESALLSVAATCRQLYMLAVPLIYRRIHLHDRVKQPEFLLRRLTKDDSKIPVFIREIVINPGYWLNESNLELLVKVISKSMRLEILSWSCTYNVPEVILQALEQFCPSTRLIVSAVMYPSLTGRQEEDTGFSSPTLHSLTCLIPYNPSQRRKAKLCLFKILKSSPNLRKLVINQESAGCVMFGWDPNRNVELDVRSQDQLPQLEELAFPLFSVQDMVKWGDMGGWANLRSLKIKNSNILQAFAGRVPCLQSLVADVTWNDLQLNKLLFFRLGPLEELVLNGKEMRFPFDILEAYGKTLTILTVHAPEPYDPERRSDIPIAELQQLNAICPNLQNLGVDMNRDGEWPYDFLKELAKFPALTHLTLAAEGRRGGASPVLPLVDHVSTKHLFGFLRSHKIGQPLFSLSVQRGGMAPHSGGYPAYNVLQEQDYRSLFECRLNSSGSISTMQEGGKPMREIINERLRKLDRECRGSPFKGYSELELARFALLLDIDRDKTKLASGDGCAAKFVPDLMRGEEIKLKYCFGGSEGGMSAREDRTARLVEALQVASDEQRCDYKRQLEEELVKIRRKQLMEKAFPDYCTLYDVFRNRK